MGTFGTRDSFSPDLSTCLAVHTINHHLKVAFEDIIAEPEGIRSMDCVWTLSNKCFKLCQHLIYWILTFFYGICIAIEWGQEFAYIAFIHIWYITPFFKVLEINCGCCKKVYGTCVHCCLDPLCEACGLLFHQF